MRYTVLYMMLLIIGVISAKAQHQSYNCKVHFNSDEYVLDQEDETLLNQLLSSIPQTDYYEVTLTAHTDSDADISYNEALSAKRAASVREYLQKRGVLKNRFYVKCYGERAPVESNSEDKGKLANRRVEVVLHRYQFNNTTSMLKAAGGDYRQKFTINPLQENTITGKNGVRVVIPASSIVDKKGNVVNSPVTVELSEFLKPADALYQSLSTQTTDGQNLETGGMFTIEAFTKGEAVQLKSGATMRVDIPATQPKSDMLVFNAKVNNAGITTWETNGKQFAATTDNSNIDLRLNATKDFSKANFNFATPQAPFKPKEPQMPKLEGPVEERKHFSFWKRVLLTKKQKEMKLIEANHRRENTNAVVKNEYKKQLIAYERKLKNYETSMVAYEQAHGQRFNQWVDEQIAIQKSVLMAIEASRKHPEKLSNIEKLLAGYEVPYMNVMMPVSAEEMQYARLREKHGTVLNELRKMKELGVAKCAQIYGHRGTIRLFNRRGKSYPYDYVMNMQDATSVEVKELVSVNALKEAESSIDNLEERIEFKVTYAAYLSAFGTINCDRFSKVPENRMANVKVKLNKEAKVVFYIPKQKSYLFANYDGSSYSVKLPIDEEYTLLVMANENRAPMFFSQQGNIQSTQEIITPKMKEATLAEVKEKFESL